MTLADRVTNPPERKKTGPPCSVGWLLANLEPAERDALTIMLGDETTRGWSAGRIYDALTAEGHPVGFQTINRHRAGHCGCA